MVTGDSSGRLSYGSSIRVTKRQGKARQQVDGSAGVFSCFSLAGDNISLHKRSAFSSSRKKEVRGIRKKGACLRCRMLKRACSGEDPCKTCIIAAKAAAGSKVLMWMDCIRPSFQTMNIFDGGNYIPDQGRIEFIISDLLDDDVHLDFHIPFALNVEAASSQLASWLSDDHSKSAFSVVGVFSCSTSTSLLQNALDPNLGKDLRLFVHLTTHLYTTDMQGGYQEYTDEEIRSVRDFVGNRLLLAFDALLRPSELEATEDKLSKLKSLFLLILGTTVGMRYTCPEIMDEPEPNAGTAESKQEALMRLLCHYLIYIGKATSLLEASSDERTLVNKWRSQWNKPAAFTWNSSNGLEMHYRIQPPADYIVSSAEDDLMNRIDFDLSQLDDGDDLVSSIVNSFTVNSDLLKCAACNTFWAMLDVNGYCQNCQVPFDADWINQDASFTGGMDVSFGGSISLDGATSLDSQLSLPWQYPSSWDMSSTSSTGTGSHLLPLFDTTSNTTVEDQSLAYGNNPPLIFFETCSSVGTSNCVDITPPPDSGSQPSPAFKARSRRISFKTQLSDAMEIRSFRCCHTCKMSRKLCSSSDFENVCNNCRNRLVSTSLLELPVFKFDRPVLDLGLQDPGLKYMTQTSTFNDDQINNNGSDSQRLHTDCDCGHPSEIGICADFGFANLDKQHTSEGAKQQLRCSVPSCLKTFSRPDNLRRHEQRCPSAPEPMMCQMEEEAEQTNVEGGPRKYWSCCDCQMPNDMSSDSAGCSTCGHKWCACCKEAEALIYDYVGSKTFMNDPSHAGWTYGEKTKRLLI